MVQRKAGKLRFGSIRDPNAPKKPLSAYFMFLQHIRADAVRHQDIFGDEHKTTAQSVLAAQKWRVMNDSERKVCVNLDHSFPPSPFLICAICLFFLFMIVLGLLPLLTTWTAGFFFPFSFLLSPFYCDCYHLQISRLRRALPDSTSNTVLRIEYSAAANLFSCMTPVHPFRLLTSPIPLRSRDPGCEPLCYSFSPLPAVRRGLPQNFVAWIPSIG